MVETLSTEVSDRFNFTDIVPNIHYDDDLLSFCRKVSDLAETSSFLSDDDDGDLDEDIPDMDPNPETDLVIDLLSALKVTKFS